MVCVDIQISSFPLTHIDRISRALLSKPARQGSKYIYIDTVTTHKRINLLLLHLLVIIVCCISLFDRDIYPDVNKYQRRFSFIIGVMHSFTSIFLLIAYLTCSNSIVTSQSSSTSFQQADQQLLVNGSKSSNLTNANNELSTRKSRQQIVDEHFKILLVIGVTSIGIITVLVIVLIVGKVLCAKQNSTLETTEQTMPLQGSKQAKQTKVPKKKTMPLL